MHATLNALRARRDDALFTTYGAVAHLHEATTEQIAAYLDTGPRRVRRALSTLEDRGWIVDTEGPDAPTYRLSVRAEPTTYTPEDDA